MAAPLGMRVRTWAMSTLVTRIIRAPKVELTSRAIPDNEIVHIPTRHGSVRCYITRPPADAPLAANGATPPVVINTHGGGFVIGNPLQDNHLARGIAGEVGTVVVNVDYSTAPKARFPQALEECFDVLRWVARSGDTMGWDGTRIAVTGSSAGGNLALGTLTQTTREHGPAVRAAALIVPAVDLSIPPAEATLLIEKPFVNAGMLEMVDTAYPLEDTDRKDPLVSPSFLSDAELRALPPTLVVTAEHDTLRPSIEEFTARAVAVGAPVETRRFDDVDHDFYYASSTPKATLDTLMAAFTAHLLEHLR
ncbi:alpha/beta hydrolase [Curtobacterium sp. MCBD17_013]|nr:alpha/beta hydrolase [Curtobacterium sp. MCBD17_013]